MVTDGVQAVVDLVQAQQAEIGRLVEKNNELLRELFEARGASMGLREQIASLKLELQVLQDQNARLLRVGPKWEE